MTDDTSTARADDVSESSIGASAVIGQGATRAGFAGEMWNGDFSLPPPDTASNIDDNANPLPGWSFVQSVGTTITAALVADATLSTGYKLVFTSTGGPGNISYLEQIVPIVGSPGSLYAWSYFPTSWRIVGTTHLHHRMEAQYLTVDGSTTGTAHVLTSLTAGEVSVNPNANGTPPANAAFLRIRIGAEGMTSTASTVTVYRVEVPHGSSTVRVTDSASAIHRPLGLRQVGGDAYIETASGSGPYIWMVASSGDLNLVAGSTSSVNLVRGRLKFSAGGVASADVNTLDAYEEGTFTPTLTFATPGNVSVSYSIRVGAYTKVGDRVFYSFNITTSGFTHTTAAGNLTVSGLPFTSNAVSTVVAATSIAGWTKAGYTSVNARVTASATTVVFPAQGSGQAQSNLTSADVPTGGTVVMQVSGHYGV
jgi:hypothetical protein